MRLYAVVAIGAAVGIIIAIVLTRKIKTPQKSGKNDISELISKQIICDELDVQSIVNWFKDTSEEASSCVFFLAKPTEYTAQLFALSGDIRVLDQDHNLLQVIVDKRTKLPKHVRLISYDSMPAMLSDKLNGKEYIIVNND